MGSPVAKTETEKWSPEQTAAAALLVNAARVDGYFSPEERETILAALQSYFNLGPDQAAALIEEGKKQGNATSLHPVMLVLRTRLTETQRQELALMVRDVVYSDGVLDPIEAHLLLSMSQLLNIPADDAEASRSRVLAALGITREVVRQRTAIMPPQDR